MADRNELRGIAPLSESTLFILLSLAPAPKHGYAIMKDTRRLSEGRVILSTGTLYGALKRLLDLDWIERVNDTNANGNRERKAYALTRQGRRVLEAEVARLRALVSIAHHRNARARA
ncbi:MAG: PadR family transcriptional regulator [Acidobacteriota bacterium]